MLTAQSPLIRAVIQDGIERTRASLVFINAFPNLFETLEYIEKALVTAAESMKAAASIHRRLLGDHLYSINMSRAVSSSHIISIRVLTVDVLFSLVRAYPFSAGTSRTAVWQLYRLNSWPFHRIRGSYSWPESNYQNITTPFRRRQM